MENDACPAQDKSPASGCPFPHSGEDDAARWDMELKQKVDERASANAKSSHLDEVRAVQMAEAAVETRAGEGEISEALVRALGKKLGYGHPLSDRTGVGEFHWTPEALEMLGEVPEFCRELTRWRVEWTAHKLGLGSEITPGVVRRKYDLWGEVSHQITARTAASLPWTESAKRRFDKVPEFVKGQVLQAIEGNARMLGAGQIDDAVVDAVTKKWAKTGDFHEGRYGFK